MRFAGQVLTAPQPIQDTFVPGIDPRQLAPTPELPPATLQNEADQMRYILAGPGGGIALLPGGVQGPAQGPNIPIKNYGGVYMPDATQPTGYRPGPLG